MTRANVTAILTTCWRMAWNPQCVGSVCIFVLSGGRSPFRQPRAVVEPLVD